MRAKKNLKIFTEETLEQGQNKSRRCASLLCSLYLREVSCAATSFSMPSLKINVKRETKRPINCITT